MDRQMRCSSIKPGIQGQQALATPGLRVLVDVGKAPQCAPSIGTQEAQLAASYQGAQRKYVCIVIVLPGRLQRVTDCTASA